MVIKDKGEGEKERKEKGLTVTSQKCWERSGKGEGRKEKKGEVIPPPPPYASSERVHED